MNNIFLDLGSNIGQGYEFFREIYGSEYEYHLYEPNPHCFSVLLDKYGLDEGVFLHKEAVYTEDGTTKFYLEEPLSQGGSIINTHNNLYYSSKNVDQHDVKMVDINKVIKNFKDKKIIIKMDVESSEYDILDHMISEGTINMVDKIICEFHSMYMKPKDQKKYRDREMEILKYMAKNHINFLTWF